jgi:hypothetical protein
MEAAMAFGNLPEPDLLGGAYDHLEAGVLVTAARELYGEADRKGLSESDATEAPRRIAVR